MNEKEFQGYTEKKLYELLPAVYRQRDSDLGYPLKDLIAILAKQVAILEKDIGGLYENWFIETCDEWVTAYLADLVGAKSLSTSRISSLSTTVEVTQRAYVANTIGYRRRKGTLSMLEQLARDTTQWGARAVEFFKLLGTTQNINHVRIANHRTPDLRNTAALELLNTPFDTIAHTVEVRRIASNRGRYNIPNVGLFLWRLMAFPSYDTLAYGHFEPNSTATTTTKFSFNPFGYDIPLFNKPEEESSISSIAGEVNLPVPIRRRAMYDEPYKFYGRERSILVEVKHEGESSFLEIPLKDIQICKMGKNMQGADIWAKPAEGKTAAIDPETGRISLLAPAQEVRVTYYYGFSGTIGGGMYKRDMFEVDTEFTVYKISKRTRPNNSNNAYTSIKAALNAWSISSNSNDDDEDNHKNVIFEIDDSEEYEESLSLELPVGCTAAIVASNEKRPILSSLIVKGEKGSTLVLDGLWFKNPLEMPIITIDAGDIRSISIRHCTLLTWKDVGQLKVAIGSKSSIRRSLCIWEVVPTDNKQSQMLLKFLKKNFANWIIDDPDKMNITMEKSEDGMESMTITTKDIATKNAIELVIEDTSAAESVCRMNMTKDGQTKENVYEFIVMRQNGKKNLYLNGGNDDLELSLNRSISGRIKSLNSFVFNWEKILGDENERKQLVSFLKDSFNLPWLTENTTISDNWDRIDDHFNGSVITAQSQDHKQSLTITAEEDRAVLRLIDNENNNPNLSSIYEFALIDKNVYFQSDARLTINDCIIDGNGSLEAIEARSVSIQNTTVFGKTQVGKLKLASNSIFTDLVHSIVTQEGCIRFSYVPNESVTPRRYMCKPDETAQVIEPKFTSEKYADPGYAQLDRTIALDIFAGADNKAEMGAFNYLFEPPRLADLRASLNEYLRFGLEVGVFLVT